MGEGSSKMAGYYCHHDDTHLQADSDAEQNVEDCMPQGVPEDTLIIFDWDDTLLCSSAINAQQWTPLQLQQLEKTIESVLSAALKLGETMIVTNGNATWVQDSTRRFLPNLQSILEKVTVVSARACHEQCYPGDPFSWKRLAFKEILARREDRGPGHGVNLVVIGDSPAEIQAAHNAIQVASGRSLVKTIKFKDAPSVNELLGQLRRTLQDLPSIIVQDGSTSKGLVPRPGHIDHLASWGSSWRISEAVNCSRRLGAKDGRRRMDAMSWLLHALA